MLKSIAFGIALGLAALIIAAVFLPSHAGPSTDDVVDQRLAELVGKARRTRLPAP